MAVLVAGLLAALFEAPSEAQQIRNSTLSGKVLSASGTASSGEVTTFFTVPPSGTFILTQSCREPSPVFYGFVSVTGFGELAGFCARYDPGLALPPGAEVRCDASRTTATICTITGILSIR